MHGFDVVLKVGVTLKEPVGAANPAVKGQVIRAGVLDAVLPLLMPEKHICEMKLNNDTRR